MKVFFYSFFVVLLFGECQSPQKKIEPYSSNTLKIERISENVFKHISFLEIPNYGKFPCNGMIYLNSKEAIIFDSPTEDTAASELIDWIENDLGRKVKAVVINHFHNDCLGGLEEFHKREIKSYSSNKTIQLALANNEAVPQIGFEEKLELDLGNKKTVTKFYGEGHTTDNVVSYIPSEKVLFGGCLIKEDGAGKGNLVDANVEEWANTVKRVKKGVGEIIVVIPGHGNEGGSELLDYTIELFRY